MKSQRDEAEESSVDERVMRDMMQGVHQTMCTSASTMVPGSLAIPAVYWWSANRVGMVIGMAIALALSVPIHRYLKGFDVATHPNPLRALTLANGAANGIWALLPMWMMPEQADAQYLILALPFAMLVTNLAATAAVRRVYLAGQIPLAVGAIAAFAIFADGNTKWAAAVIPVTVLVLDGLGQDWGRTARGSVLLQHKNERLLENLEATNIVLEHHSRHDHLTGLPNRRAFTEFVDGAGALGQAVAAKRGRLAIMLIDLDNFKAANDQHGHQCGDEVLQLAANRLRSSVPTDALLSRLGGDEFALAWRGAPPSDVLMDLAARINAELRSPFVIDNKSVRISASIGVAGDNGGALAPTDVLRNADEALYTAKANGRDQATAFEATPNEPRPADRAAGRFGPGLESR